MIFLGETHNFWLFRAIRIIFLLWGAQIGAKTAMLVGEGPVEVRLGGRRLLLAVRV
jgi:hypothetical protein